MTNYLEQILRQRVQKRQAAKLGYRPQDQSVHQRARKMDGLGSAPRASPSSQDPKAVQGIRGLDIVA